MPQPETSTPYSRAFVDLDQLHKDSRIWEERVANLSEPLKKDLLSRIGVNSWTIAIQALTTNVELQETLKPQLSQLERTIIVHRLTLVGYELRTLPLIKQSFQKVFRILTARDELNPDLVGRLHTSFKSNQVSSLLSAVYMGGSFRQYPTDFASRIFGATSN